MGIAKRPKLATGYSGPRAGSRDAVSLEARCSVGEGAAIPVAVLDLDAGGCRVRGITAAVTKGAEVQLWLGTVGPIEARLRWVKLGSAGLAFCAPLADDALEEARTSARWSPPPRVIAMRRGAISGGT